MGLLLPIEMSARHVHVTQEQLEILFGPGTKLEPRNALNQPGIFVSTSRVDVEGPTGTLKRLSILGPCRSYYQVELSRSDAIRLGLNPPIRDSGNIKNSTPIRIIGPKGTLDLPDGAIIPWRHIHMSPETAQAHGFTDREIVSVRINSQERPLVFGNVLVRVRPAVNDVLHIDTDEANSCGYTRTLQAEILKEESPVL